MQSVLADSNRGKSTPRKISFHVCELNCCPCCLKVFIKASKALVRAGNLVSATLADKPTSKGHHNCRPDSPVADPPKANTAAMAGDPGNGESLPSTSDKGGRDVGRPPAADEKELRGVAPDKAAC